MPIPSSLDGLRPMPPSRPGWVQRSACYDPGMQTARRAPLDAVEVVHLPHRALAETVRVLQDFGREGNEGLVLWVGQIEGTVATIQSCLVPPQESIRSEDGIGYFLTSETLFNLNRFLSDKRLRLIAQIHSHPTEAYHSAMDDKYAIVAIEGGFSLVVPYFARTEHTPAGWAVYRLRNARWQEVSPAVTRQIFQLVG